MEANHLKTLEEKKADVLAEWWAELNHWSWPKGLESPGTICQHCGKYPIKSIANSRALEIMEWIEAKIGKTKCLEAWNRKNT